MKLYSTERMLSGSVPRLYYGSERKKEVGANRPAVKEGKSV